MTLNPAQIKAILVAEQGAALKRLGQHFLIDKQALGAIAGVAGGFKRDIIVEVGPGLGALTEELLKLDTPLIAVEKDALAVDVLKRRFKAWPGFIINKADILKFPEARLPRAPYTLVANLPYNITTPFLVRFLLKIRHRPAEMVVLLQKEAAARVTAKAPNMDPLAYLAARHSQADIRLNIGPGAFWPKPKVNSALVVFKNIPAWTKTRQQQAQHEFELITRAFTYPRKTLLNITARLFITKNRSDWQNNLKQAGLGPESRPATLNSNDWQTWLKLVAP